jgi:hypothetical protein
MTPIPGEPLEPQVPELTTSDGRKVKLKLPGLTTPVKPHATEQRGGAEPPRNDPRAPIDPNVMGPLP